MPESSPQQVILALLDEAPMRPVHYGLWMLSCGGTLLDGFSIFALGVALPLVVADLGIESGTVVGLIGAAIVLGAVVGAAVGGPAADRFGRKRLMLVDMALIAAGAGLSAAASSPWLLFAGQLTVGIGIGIDFPIGGAYISELMPQRNRGRMMVAAIACQSLGMLLAAALIMLILWQTTDSEVWRLFLAVAGMIAVVFLLLRLAMPESVRWLMSQGRNAEAAMAMARLLPEEQGHAQALASAAGNAVHHVALVARGEQPLGWRTLFRREYILRTVLVSVPWFLMDVATYGVGLFTPVILGAIHFSHVSGGPVAADLADVKGSGAIDLFLLVGFLLGLWAVPKFGRIRLQVIGFAGMATGMLTLWGATQMPGGAEHHVVLVFTGFILFNLLMNAGPNATTFTLAPELFPTALRASAGGFAAGVAKLGATLGVFLLPIVKDRLGVPAVLVLMATVSILGVLVTAMVAHEVAEAVPLEDHQRARHGAGDSHPRLQRRAGSG
jgi:MFS family permease